MTISASFFPLYSGLPETLFSGTFSLSGIHTSYSVRPPQTVGTYALTYPPTYLSYWIAKTVLGDVNATIEVFAVFHLLAGYLCCFIALRKLDATPVLSATGAMCWALSGWFLVAGRSQFNFTPVAVYLPLLVIAVHDVTQETARNEVGSGNGRL